MSILRRTVFMEVDRRTPANGVYHRPHDWAVTTTTLGSMAEPFNMFDRHVPGVSMTNADWTDSMRRVDIIEIVDLDKMNTFLGDNVHGGLMLPRTGR